MGIKETVGEVGGPRQKVSPPVALGTALDVDFPIVGALEVPGLRGRITTIWFLTMRNNHEL